MGIASGIGAIVGPLIKLITGTIGKVTQAMLLIQIIYVATVIIPLVVLAVIYMILMFSTTNSVTNFLSTGHFQSGNAVNISATSPMMIIFYSGIILGLIALIIFILNGMWWYGVKRTDVTLRQRWSWVLYFILGLILIPVFFIILNFFAQIIGKLFINISGSKFQNFSADLSQNNLFKKVQELINQINALQLNNVLPPLNQTEFDNLYNKITNPQIQQQFQTLQSMYNTWINSWNTGMVNGFLKDYSLVASNPQAVLEVFNGYVPLFNSLTNLSENLTNNLIFLKVQIPATDYAILEKMMGTYFMSSTENISEILNSLSKVTSTLANGTFDHASGDLLATNNLVYYMFFLLTGHHVVSINQMLTHWPIPLSEPWTIAKAIVIGAFVNGMMIKVFLNLTLICINRLLQSGVLAFWGLIAIARGVNDTGAIARVWFRQSLAAMLGVLVVMINLQIYMIIVWTIINLANTDKNWFDEITNSVSSGNILKNLDVKSILLLLMIMIFAIGIDLSSQRIIQRITDAELNPMAKMSTSVLGGQGSMKSVASRSFNAFSNQRLGQGSSNLAKEPFSNFATGRYNSLVDQGSHNSFKGAFFKSFGNKTDFKRPK